MLGTGRATVLDADALSSFADEPQALFGAIAEHSEGACVLTPHTAEFARLFQGVVATCSDKLSCARAAARASGAIVVLKGSDTDPAYLFRHALLRDAAYGSLWERDRRRLHGVIAEAIEDAPDAATVEEITSTAVRQLRMITVGVAGWRSDQGSIPTVP
jgi:hypothetical protein